MTYDQFIEEWKNATDYISARTSGSTGQPKDIQLNKKFVKESALRTNKFFNISRESRLHSCVDPDFIGGKMMAVRAILENAEFSWEKATNKPLTGLDKNNRIDLLAVVPSQMISIIERLDEIPDIRNIIIGGSAIHPVLKKKILESGLNCYETYGMTETASHIALRKISGDNRPFKLLPGIKIKQDGEDCLKIIFESGEVVQTNDIVKILSDNEFYIMGRRDNVIISGGKKINPLEIEARISDLIDTEFFIAGIPDEKWGQKLLLFIEGDPWDTSGLSQGLKNCLEPWEVPKEIKFKKEFARTPNGKIIRN